MSITTNMDKKQFHEILLDGEWDFTYSEDPGVEKIPVIPESCEFAVKIPVPGYWDEHLDRMKSAPFWSKARFNPNYKKISFPMQEPAPDASLPFLLGVGWYRRCFFVNDNWKSKMVNLTIGGILLEAWVWVNGKLVGYHLGHSTPFEMLLNKYLEFGRINELIIAVANTRTDRSGCVIRGYKGFSAGIYRSVVLKISERARIKYCYIYPINKNRELQWDIELDGDIIGENSIFKWSIVDPDVQSILAYDTAPIKNTHIKFSTGVFGMIPWSEHSPKLYQIKLELNEEGHTLDELVQSFGLRQLNCNGMGLEINGRPVILRGATEHSYFPLTCTPPKEIEFYRGNIKKLKQIGFNWLRFHTWVPSEEYMQAADELGMMIQVEAPVGFMEQEWVGILLACRKHPSVVIYCCGNEELLNENKIEFTRQMGALCREYVPDGLFNPQEALRGVEYYWDKSDIGENVVEYPFLHNPSRLNKLKEFSDVFGQYVRGFLSYTSSKGDWRNIDERLKIYERPCLSHENGIHGNYINLDLEHRYEGTRIGSQLFAEVRRYLKSEGLLNNAVLYYRNSCAWMRILRKHNIEMARKCKYIAGYDFLGAIDHHWHRCGYPCGIMNEFYELKPGESVEDVLKYNGESVLLLDHTNKRNFFSCENIEFDIMASLYGRDGLKQGCLTWYLADEKHCIHQRGEIQLYDICNGMVEKLGEIQIKIPYVEKPIKLTLTMKLSGGEYEIVNNWDFWAFPHSEVKFDAIDADERVMKKYCIDFSATNPIKQGELCRIRVVENLDKDAFDFLNAGGNVILVGSEQFPVIPMRFQIYTAGRVDGNLATVIYDHPLLNDFPHDGYCDWQFYSMLEGGNAVVFNDLNIPFKPIIEIVSSFKQIKKQSCLFELKVGRGRLLVCTLNLDISDPASIFLFNSMIYYMENKQTGQLTETQVDEIEKIVCGKTSKASALTTDQGFDINAQIKNKTDK